jgi:hypothetical protein
MRRKLRHRIAIFVSLVALEDCVGAGSARFWNSQGNATMPAQLIPRDEFEFFDETDLSFIKKIAAIGDSYSAGIGAGARLGNVFEAFQSDSGRSTLADATNQF